MFWKVFSPSVEEFEQSLTIFVLKFLGFILLFFYPYFFLLWLFCLWLFYFLLCKALWITTVYEMCYINKLPVPQYYCFYCIFKQQQQKVALLRHLSKTFKKNLNSTIRLYFLMCYTAACWKTVFDSYVGPNKSSSFNPYLHTSSESFPPPFSPPRTHSKNEQSRSRAPAGWGWNRTLQPCLRKTRLEETQQKITIRSSQINLPNLTLSSLKLAKHCAVFA